jgi:hypothetical protein
MAKHKKTRKTRCWYYVYCFGRLGKVFVQWHADHDLEDGKAPFELERFPGEWIVTWKALRVFVLPWMSQREADEPLWGIN